MQIVISLLFIVASFLFASNINIKSGWQLLGTQSKISDMSIFDKDGITSVFSYQDNIFVSYPKESSIPLLTELLGGEGYWVNASKNLTLTIDDSLALGNGSIYGVNVVKGWRLLGTLQDLCLNHIFNNPAINSVWSYEPNLEWKQYTPTNVNNLTKIDKGRGYWVHSSENLQLMPYMEISGNIVDGYIKDARLEIASLDTGKTLPIVTNPITLNSSTSIQSGDKGAFKIYINSNSASSYVIRTVGGDDKSSGEKFEGVLKGVVPNFGCSEPDTSVRHITPISSIVTKAFSDAQKTEKSLRIGNSLLDDTENKVALLLGVDKEFLAKDPILLLQSSSLADKNSAARLLKSALVIEKTAEAIAKSVTSSSNIDNIHISVEIAMDILAKTLSQTTTDFNTTMLDVTTLIDNSVGSFSDIQSKDKLDSVKDILRSTTQFALNIDEDSYKSGNALNQIEFTQKAIEVITGKIEQKLQNVATADSNFTVHAIAAKDVVKAIAISGGIGGTRALVKNQVERLSEQNQKLDISDFTDKLLSDDTISKKSTQYNEIFGNEISTEIVEVASVAFKEIIEKKVAGEIVTADDATQIIAKNITALDIGTQQDINSKAVAIKDAISSDADVLISTTKSIADDVVFDQSVIMSSNWLAEVDQLMSWQDAASYCASASARLPTVDELQKSYSSDIDGFSSVHYYWSSTEDSSDSKKAFRVFFDKGLGTSTNKTDNSFVRCLKL